VTDFANAVDRPYGQQPETRAAAARYIVRRYDIDAATELLLALGLAHDPIAEQRSRRKALADLHTKGGRGRAS
jgi:hypothetical protein